ncbi:DUF6193 family natural product biosynthesis protein [Micromonospora profundi]|uniref:DUF6193 family natural product biosynthesis protein n=1 Tax=Micromonospora profundi TaxID=1420889 RepID=UPI00364DB673
MPAPVPEQIYPDVAAFGSLAAALRAAAERDGLDLDGVTTARTPGWINVGARVARADRIASVVMASEVRAFSSELWSKGVCLSGGTTGDLEMTARLLAFWCGGATLAEVRERYPFMNVGELALAHERGTAVEVKWRLLLESAPDPVRPAVEAAAGQPLLRGLFPFLSHNTLRFSRCTGYPYSADVPHIEATSGNRFRVVAPGGTLVVEGVNARDAAAAIASSLPPGFPPAVAGTAPDLA